MNTKICTSIEQSKKLLSIGLDPSTSDMHYREWKRATKDIRIAHMGKAGKKDMPAWSLTALLELMPDIIKVDEEYYTFSLIKNVIEYVRHDGNILYSVGGESFVDAAVKMFELIDNSKNTLK